MDKNSNKEVSFYIYCEKCKYKKLDERNEPCNSCLEVPVREGTIVPKNFKDA